MIEFQAIPDLPDRTDRMATTVALEGHHETYAPGIGVDVNNGDGWAAAELAKILAPADDAGWVVVRRGANLLIKGWTDQKTRRFYPVTDVTVTTDPAHDPTPQELLPKVKDRRPKG